MDPRIVRPAAIVAGLALVTCIRWVIVISGAIPALSTGIGFGVALAAIALVGGARTPRLTAVSVGIGIGGGLLLVGLALEARVVAAPSGSFSPAAAFLPWAGVTVLVATAEELLLRASLFDAIAGDFGDLGAVVATSMTFAVMHVPLYGWHVVPLDLGVGLLLGGLRLVSGGVVAPAIAHVIADLATWWL